MKKSLVLAASSALIVSGSVFAQDVPDPNPVPNADGTQTWYCGNNTQYPIIQQVLDACADGDEIVVMEGQYVESLLIDRNDVTLRSATDSAGTAAGADHNWQSVVFWNPTEGFENNNGHAMHAQSNTSGTYIGRPREFAQLANGDIVPNEVPVGDLATDQEWEFDANYTVIVDNAYTNTASFDVLQDYTDDNGNLAMEFWSRSLDDVAIRTTDSGATFSYCTITSQNGFGGGLLCTGANNASSFVNCVVEDTWAGGQQLDGFPVHAVSIQGGQPMFAGCTVQNNEASSTGVIAQSGGNALWMGCRIITNDSNVSDGTYVCTGGGVAQFHSCTFDSNQSRLGTIYFDSSLNADDEPMVCSNTIFSSNTTIDLQYGAVAYCTDAVAGRNPLFVLDRCTLSNTGQTNGTQSGTDWWETDVSSNYFPSYRVLRDLSSGTIDVTANEDAGVAALSAANSSATAGPDLNGDGRIDGLDLAIILGAWGS
ncbi:MAG: hypothetical protein VX641_06840 [Planctomycetota bacterium]|nr:hypothetical protein [Planctomycetota bacterium]